MISASLSHFGTNLKFLRDRKAQSQERLSVELAMTRTQLNAYENGHTKNPTVEVMMKVSKYFNISLDVLMKENLAGMSEGKIEELQSRADRDIAGDDLRIVVTTVNVDNKPNIEHVPIKAKAGYLAGYGDADYISKLPVYSLPILPKDKKFRSFPSEGDSMYPFPESAVIVGEYIDNWFSLKVDVPCIVVTKDEGVVFKLVTNRIKEKRVLELKSLNNVYQPYSVNVHDVLEIWKYKCYIYDGMPDRDIIIERMASDIKEIRSDIKRFRSNNN